MKKVLLAASSGGHLDEISNLDKLAEEHEVILLTEKTDCGMKGWFRRVYCAPQVNRKEILCFPKLITNAFKSLWLLLKEKPQVGLIGKMLGKKVIYIESFARIDGPSLTGKLLYKVADATIIQWPELKRFYPNAIYGGSIY